MDKLRLDPLSWPQCEAAVFLIRHVGRNVDNDESVNMPHVRVSVSVLCFLLSMFAIIAAVSFVCCVRLLFFGCV